MKIVEIAELISALAALFTVSLAVFELANRKKLNSAAVAMDTYADFLHIKQITECALGSLESLANHAAALDTVELKAYARKHMLDPKDMALVPALEKRFVTNLNPLKDESQKVSKLAMELSSRISQLLANINTVYQLMLEQDTCPVELVKSHYDRLSAEYRQMAPDVTVAGRYLHDNLTQTHRNENMHLFVLFALSFIFIIICLLV